MQYAEELTDRQAAEAVRTRIDWKYVLSLELTDLGFDFSVLSEFRANLCFLTQKCRKNIWKRNQQWIIDTQGYLLAAKVLGASKSNAEASRCCPFGGKGICRYFAKFSRNMLLL